MSSEFPSQPSLPQEKPPELPKSGDMESVAFEALSLEALAVLQEEIETLEGKLAFAWGRKNETIKGKALEEMQKAFSKNPKLIRQGLQYGETSLSTLHLIGTAWDLTRKREDGRMQHFSDGRMQHFSERGLTENEKLAVVIESQVMESEGSLLEILNDEKKTEREFAFDVVSGLLDSPLEHHREYGESMLMEHLPVLAELFSDKLRIFREDEIVRVWQEMFLRVENPQHLKQICEIFKAVWERRREKEEEEKEKKEAQGETVSEGRDWNDLYDNVWRRIFATHHKAFEFNKDFVLKIAIDMTGLDGSKMMKEWMQVGDAFQEEKIGPSHQYAYGENLKSLYELKQSSSEAPQALNSEFGITHFGRYTRETLLRQYEERDEQKSYGIVLFPVADHNGAFFSNAFQLDQLQEALGKGGYGMRITEASSKESVARQLIGLDRKYGQGDNAHKISFSLIGGHGTEQSISFGEGYHDRERLTSEDLSGKGIERGAEKFFEREAKTILFSCSTGAEEGIAEEMFKRLGLLVQAPKNNAHISHISVSFDDRNKPIFQVEYRDMSGRSVPTMSYRATQEADESIEE